MLILIYQELFKLAKKRSTWLSLAVLIVVQLTFAFLAKNNPSIFNPQETFMAGYYGTTLIVFYLIAASSSIVTMEFEYGTIKTLLYRQYSRGMILVSKWVSILIYSIAWIAVIIVNSLLIKVILFPKIDLTASVGRGYDVISSTLVVDGANLLTVWLILSVVLLLSNLFKSSAAAISVGVVGFLVTGMMSGLINEVVEKWSWLKWNPLNMMMYPAQITDPSEIQLTHLTLNQLFYGNVGYICILLFAGYLVFRQRSV